MTIVHLQGEDFHDAFSRALGFFPEYGRNMDAWIDVMSSLDAPVPGLSDFRLKSGEHITLFVENAREFRTRNPNGYRDLLECSAIVNASFAKAKKPGPIALAMEGT